MVRAPHTIGSAAAGQNTRITLTPAMLSGPCCSLVISCSTPSAPTMLTLAGALWTPRVASIFAQMPAR